MRGSAAFWSADDVCERVMRLCQSSNSMMRSITSVGKVKRRLFDVYVVVDGAGSGGDMAGMSGIVRAKKEGRGSVGM
jgi:hypothetical protein